MHLDLKWIKMEYKLPKQVLKYFFIFIFFHLKYEINPCKVSIDSEVQDFIFNDGKRK